MDRRPQTDLLRAVGVLAAAFIMVTMPALAGDRVGVTDIVGSIVGPWNDALFSIDVSGPTKDGEAVLDQELKIEHEAAVPGYVTYLRVSSHGDMLLFRYPAAAGSMGTDSYVVKPPLGSEQIIALYSSAPLDALFPAGANSRELGSDSAAAQAFARQLQQLEAQGIKVAKRRFAYSVATVSGGTEYTTRSIVKRVEEAPGQHRAGGVVAKIPSRVEFEFDSDRLTDQGKRDLDEFGEALISKLRNHSVTLEGHTDSLGTDGYNSSLSQRRAMAVRQYLVSSFGIPESQLAAIGKGKSDPVASNDSDAGRLQNRRVDFIFIDSPENAAH
jgi:outer membrane protein OmpA-like peptidoglycan-associated protein